jgi:hypothetical protein
VIWPDAVQCSAVQCIAVQCSAVQCSAVQCSAVQCIEVQCSAFHFKWPVFAVDGIEQILNSYDFELLCTTLPTHCNTLLQFQSGPENRPQRRFRSL